MLQSLLSNKTLSLTVKSLVELEIRVLYLSFYNVMYILYCYCFLLYLVIWLFTELTCVFLNSFKDFLNTAVAVALGLNFNLRQ